MINSAESGNIGTLFKFCFVGEKMVGKTAIILRATENDDLEQMME